MKIALINSEYPSPSSFGHGGIATYTYTMASALANQGNSVHILLREGTFPDQVHKTVKIHFYKYQPPTGVDRIFNSFGSGAQKWEKGHSRNIFKILNAIHAEQGLDIAEFPDYGGLAIQYRRRFPYRLVTNFHTPSETVDKINKTYVTARHRVWHDFERKSILTAQAFRCPSDALKKEVSSLYSLDESMIKVINNPVFTIPYELIDREHDENRIDILFAGRLEYRKGAELLLNNLKSILQADSRINFTFAGETESMEARSYRDAFERTLSTEERKRIWFLGPQSAYTLSVLYRRSTIFLFPSVFENAPYALFEAIAARLPVIAQASGGTIEVIRHMENGRLFPVNDTDEMIVQIKAAIEKPDLGFAMAENAYRELKEKHDPDLIVDQSIAFYKSIITPII
jgi:glycosyltransferase involved in cell wall biosynthesis